MKKVSKKLPMVVAIATALSLSFATIHQSGVIQGLKQRLGLAEEKLERTENALQAERELTKILSEEKAVLEDSITGLNLHIDELNIKIAEQKETIRYQNKKIKKLEDNVSGLTTQINELKKKGSVAASKIKKLEEERNRALLEMETLDRERSKHVEARNKAERKKRTETKKLNSATNKKKEIQSRIDNPTPKSQPKKEKVNSSVDTPSKPMKTVRDEVSSEVKTREQERIRKILTGTSVNFIDFSLHMKNNGKPLDKLKKDGWKSTIFKVDLNNATPEVIVDEDFIVQVFDLDNNKVVPVNEANTKYPDSNQGALGYKFSYEGTAMTINYFNSQKKTGSNFELRLFYSKNGVLFPLKDGTMRIVKNGKVM